MAERIAMPFPNWYRLIYRRGLDFEAVFLKAGIGIPGIGGGYMRRSTISRRRSS